MKHPSILVILGKFYLSILFFSCNKPPCETDIPNLALEIKFVNQQGQNLVCGSFAQYQIDSLQISKYSGNNYTNNASVNRALTDTTAVRLDFYVKEEISYIYYNAHSTPDTLKIKWLTKTGKSCGNNEEYKVVDSVIFNNVLVKPVNGLYYFVK